MAVYRVASDCPLCGAPLAVRHVRRTGTLFLGCTAYTLDADLLKTTIEYYRVLPPHWPIPHPEG